MILAKPLMAAKDVKLLSAETEIREDHIESINKYFKQPQIGTPKLRYTLAINLILLYTAIILARRANDGETGFTNREATMNDNSEKDQGLLNEKALAEKQTLKYAKDLALTYQEEKARRQDLEAFP